MNSGYTFGKSLACKCLISTTLMALMSAPAFAVPSPGGLASTTTATMPRATNLSQSRRFGPFATVDRANQVANYFRRMGYNASIHYAGSYLAGTREYYVDVW
jgi:hypothetical protein